MNKLTQQQKLDQSLSLTPAQIQAIKMLELTGLELEGRIERELEENPALEENYEEPQRESEDSTPEGDASDQDWELGEYATEDDIPDYKLRELQERQSVSEEIPFAAGAPSLDEYLMDQLALVTPLEGVRREIARYIIGNIDSDGYLTRSVEEIEDDLLFKAGLTVAPEEIEELIRLVKTLDPAGIAARDLRESLLLQIERLPETPLHREAYRMIQDHYEDFVNKRFDRLCSCLGVSEERLAELYTFVSHLSPKPASGYGDDSEGRFAHFTPDFIVTERDGELLISLVGERDLPPLSGSPRGAEGTARGFTTEPRGLHLPQAQGRASPMVHRRYPAERGDAAQDDDGHRRPSAGLLPHGRDLGAEAYDPQGHRRGYGSRHQYDLSGEQQQVRTDRLRCLHAEVLLRRRHHQRRR